MNVCRHRLSYIGNMLGTALPPLLVHLAGGAIRPVYMWFGLALVVTYAITYTVRPQALFHNAINGRRIDLPTSRFCCGSFLSVMTRCQTMRPALCRPL